MIIGESVMNDPEKWGNCVSPACVDSDDHRRLSDRPVNSPGTLYVFVPNAGRLSKTAVVYIPDIRASVLGESKIKEIGEKVREFPSIIKAFQN
jgi:hypothetical protein